MYHVDAVYLVVFFLEFHLGVYGTPPKRYLHWPRRLLHRTVGELPKDYTGQSCSTPKNTLTMVIKEWRRARCTT